MDLLTPNSLGGLPTLFLASMCKLIDSFILSFYLFLYWLDAGLAYTDTSGDVEAIRREMRKLGVTSGTTTDFTLRDRSAAGSRQASVTEDDNRPKTSANNTTLNAATSAGDTATGSHKRTRFQTNVAQTPSVHFDDETQEYSRSDTPSSEQKEESAADERTGRPLDVSPADRTQCESKPRLEPAPQTKPPRDQQLSTERRPLDKYAGVRSSGYGQRSPPRKLTASKSEYSPAIKQRTGLNAVHNFQLMA